MSYNGLCKHNNMAGFCPACSKEFEMYQQNECMNGGTMGITCPQDYYELKVAGFPTGQCLPILSKFAEGAGSGGLSTIATGAASSPANIAAGQQAAVMSVSNKALEYVKAHPYIVASVIGGIILFSTYGGLKFIRGK